MYPKNLLFRAKAERSPAWLSAALLAQHPEWEGQGPTLALALLPVLNLLGWDLVDLERRFFQQAVEYIPKEYLPGKLLALQAVVEAYENPRQVDFGPGPYAPLMEAGVRYSDLPHVELDGMTLYLPGYWCALSRPVEKLPESQEEYFYSAPLQVRHLHPDFLFAKAELLLKRLWQPAALHPFLPQPSPVYLRPH